MQTVINNYINGNLREAKAGARRYTPRQLYLCLRQLYGWSEYKARVTALYLKGQATFQAACDAE